MLHVTHRKYNMYNADIVTFCIGMMSRLLIVDTFYYSLTQSNINFEAFRLLMYLLTVLSVDYKNYFFRTIIFLLF